MKNCENVTNFVGQSQFSIALGTAGMDSIVLLDDIKEHHIHYASLASLLMYIAHMLQNGTLICDLGEQRKILTMHWIKLFLLLGVLS